MTDATPTVAYELRDSHTDFSGGVLAIGDESIDILEALAAGDGVIEVDPILDAPLVELLDAYPPLKRLGADEQPPADRPLEDFSRAELVERAAGLGLDAPSRASKADLLALIEAAQNPAGGDAAGDTTTEVNA